MASITIRNLPDQTKETLRVQAAQSGVSLETHAREILVEAAKPKSSSSTNLAQLAKQCFGKRYGIDLNLPERKTHWLPPEFED